MEVKGGWAARVFGSRHSLGVDDGWMSGWGLGGGGDDGGDTCMSGAGA